MKGYFISIEGTDGSGKSTQLEKMISYLKERCPRVEVTREPGGTPVAEKIRELILDPENKAMTARTEMLLYAASRAQHVEEKIRPLLEEGAVVVTDRFIDSSIAYQAYGRGLGQIVGEVNRIAADGLEPDLTIFLDLSPEEGIARKRREERHEMDRLELETLAFHRKVYEGYDALCRQNPARVARIDAAQSVEEVFSQICRALDAVLSRR